MPVHTSALGQYAVVTAEGRYDPADLRCGIDAALARFTVEPPTALLIDFTTSEALTGRETTQIRAMAQFLVSRGDAFGRRLAMVAPSVVGFGMVRLGSVTTERSGVDTCVFKTLPEAVEWLDANRPATDPTKRQPQR